MSKVFEINFEDLRPEAKRRYKEVVGDDVNEFVPIAIIEVEEQEVVRRPVNNDPKDIDGSDYFNCEQLDRLDYIQDAAHNFLIALAETTDIPHDLDAIWNVIYEGAECLIRNQHRRVRIPTHVTDIDGNEYTTDWYNE